MIEYKFELPFPVPKKNSRVTNRKTGRSFPNKRYTQWHKVASEVLRYSTTPNKPIELCEIRMIFNPPDKRRRDLTNFAESVNDLLVDNLVLEDDNWYIVKKVTLEYGIVDKDYPNVDVIIELL